MMDIQSILGYQIGSPYRGRKKININSPNGTIDMSNTDIPLFAEDETGFSKFLPPFSGMHKFPGQSITEHRMQVGGSIKAYNPNLAAKDTVFQKWYKQNTLEGKNNIPFSPNLDYDYYSYFRNGEYKNYQGGHFPDTYKQINHPTFSEESIYSVPGHMGGSWQGDKFIPRLQAGGRPPIQTSNPNDPRLRAYNDSLNVYNAAQKWNNTVDNAKTYNDTKPFWKSSEAEIARNIVETRGWDLPKGIKKQYNDGSGSSSHNNFPRPVQPVVYQDSTDKSFNIKNIRPEDVSLVKKIKNGTMNKDEMAKWDVIAKKYNIPFTTKINQYGLEDKTWNLELINNLDRLSKKIPDLKTRIKPQAQQLLTEQDTFNAPYNQIQTPQVGPTSLKTPYSFTYPDFQGNNSQQTRYFGSEDEWRKFIGNQKNVSSQQSGNTATATGNLREYQKGGAISDLFKYLFSDEEQQPIQQIQQQEPIQQEENPYISGNEDSIRKYESELQDQTDLNNAMSILNDDEENVMNYSGGRNSGSTGNFRTFSSPEEGWQALINQLDSYKTGRTRNKVGPESTLLQAMSTYAPAGDGNNNPVAYANRIASNLGVDVNTPISKIDTQAWAKEISKVEGNKIGNNPGNLRPYKKHGGYFIKQLIWE